LKTKIAYFPKGLKFTTPLIFAGAILLGFSGHYFWTVVLVILCLIILTTYYVTEIDLDKRQYHDYLTIAGIAMNNESQSFSQLDRIVITKGSYAQTVNTRVQSRQMDWSDYTATVLFDRDITLDLLTRNDKHELLVALKKMIATLPIDVEDRCGRESYFIDMTKVD
jgi:hypothetical protein